MSDSVVELRVSAHMMTLDQGLFCVYPAEDSPSPNANNGLPNICVTPAPGMAPDALNVATFRPDGWLDGAAALVRVRAPRASIVVTIYQTMQPGSAPRIQIMRLNRTDAVPVVQAPNNPPAPGEIVAHVQEAGDVLGKLGDWIGVRGSKQWIEGFGISPNGTIPPEDLEYQAVFGPDWQSPWASQGEFCGTRGVALPLLGFNVRLNGNSADAFECVYSATFIDGSTCGPLTSGTVCEAPSRAKLEAFRIVIQQRTEPEQPRRSRRRS